MDEDVGEGDARLGLPHQHATDQIGAGGRQVPWQVVATVEYHRERLAVVLLLEGRSARHQHVEDDAQAPDIHRWRQVRIAQQNLLYKNSTFQLIHMMRDKRQNGGFLVILDLDPLKAKNKL